MAFFISKLLVYPTLVYAAALESVGIRQWYNRIDETCILGALPMRYNYKKIVKDENVKAILTLNEDHELAYGVAKSDWDSMGIEFMQVKVRDYYGVASVEQLESGVAFIRKHKELNQTVYVHCKAGRYRSALMVACYLCHERNMRPEEATALLKSIRPIVVLDVKRQMTALQAYYDYITNRNSSIENKKQ